MINNGILLAGGSGTRLKPLTNFSNKHMIPIHNKFIIDYSLQTLIDLGCKEITVVLGGEFFQQVIQYLRSGANWGVKFNYILQDSPLGIAHAISLCQPYVKDNFAVVLGDNIFSDKLVCSGGPEIFLTKKRDMNRFGVASIRNGKIEKIEEKPIILDENFDNYVITGCYVFDQTFFEYFKSLVPSSRGEFEVVEIIKKYEQDGKLRYSVYESLWSDAGVFDTINQLNNYFYDLHTKKNC